jgi:D-alanyl-D-alanine carboxypeptidase
MKKKWILLTVIIAFTALTVSNLQARTSLDEKKHTIFKIVNEEQKKNDLQSVIFGVWLNGKFIVSTLGDSMTHVPTTKEMHFRVGGVTINYLITVMLQLVDEGRISLDDTLSHWFPDFPKAQEVTVKMLANCTSGYFDYIQSKKFVEVFNYNVFKEWTPEELINLSLEEPMLFEPGKGWSYSHTNFVILGEVLQKLTGETVEKLITERIIQPLKLTNTSFPNTPQIPEPVLHAFTTERDVYEDSTFWNPSWTSYSGLLISDIRDLGVWANAFGQGTLISKLSMQEMIAQTTVGLANNTKEKYYGMGVGIMNGWLVQNPRFGGYNGFMAHLPSKNLSICVVSTMKQNNSPDVNYSQRIVSQLIKEISPDQLLESR